MQAGLYRDHSALLQLRIKGSCTMKDNTMGVSKDMLHPYKQAGDDILNHMKYISEVIILATPVNPDDFDPSMYADKVTNAIKRQNSVSDLRINYMQIIAA